MAIKVYTEDFIKQTKPLCCLCGTEVKDMGIEMDYRTQEKIFWVKCHGQIEVCRLPYDFDVLQLGKGVAFSDKLLNHKTRLLDKPRTGG